MITQNYLIVEENIVTNNVIWNGDVNIWMPPANSIQLIQNDTNAMIWVLLKGDTSYTLGEVLGAGQIGFSWNGSVLITNELQPADPKTQPLTTGMQTIG